MADWTEWYKQQEALQRQQPTSATGADQQYYQAPDDYQYYRPAPTDAAQQPQAYGTTNQPYQALLDTSQQPYQPLFDAAQQPYQAPYLDQQQYAGAITEVPAAGARGEAPVEAAAAVGALLATHPAAAQAPAASQFSPFDGGKTALMSSQARSYFKSRVREVTTIVLVLFCLVCFTAIVLLFTISGSGKGDSPQEDDLIDISTSSGGTSGGGGSSPPAPPSNDSPEEETTATTTTTAATTTGTTTLPSATSTASAAAASTSAPFTTITEGFPLPTQGPRAAGSVLCFVGTDATMLEMYPDDGLCEYTVLRSVDPVRSKEVFNVVNDPNGVRFGLFLEKSRTASKTSYLIGLNPVYAALMNVMVTNNKELAHRTFMFYMVQHYVKGYGMTDLRMDAAARRIIVPLYTAFRGLCGKGATLFLGPLAPMSTEQERLNFTEMVKPLFGLLDILIIKTHVDFSTFEGIACKFTPTSIWRTDNKDVPAFESATFLAKRLSNNQGCDLSFSFTLATIRYEGLANHSTDPIFEQKCRQGYAESISNACKTTGWQPVIEGDPQQYSVCEKQQFGFRSYENQDTFGKQVVPVLLEIRDASIRPLFWSVFDVHLGDFTGNACGNITKNETRTFPRIRKMREYIHKFD